MVQSIGGAEPTFTADIVVIGHRDRKCGTRVADRVPEVRRVTTRRGFAYGAAMPPITPFLWFHGDADEAVDHYVSIFPNSRRISDSAYGPHMPLPEGTTLTVVFELDGKPFIALNGEPDFPFTPAVSFVIGCETQEEVDYYWERLLEDGQASRCGWLTDRYGLSWQVVPNRLGELASDPDPDRANRVLEAMMKMVKIDLAELEAAART